MLKRDNLEEKLTNDSEIVYVVDNNKRNYILRKCDSCKVCCSIFITVLFIVLIIGGLTSMNIYYIKKEDGSLGR